MLNDDSFVAFIQSVLERLPSSSASIQSSNITAFGDLLVDLIWSADAELEDVLSDAKSAAIKAEQGTLPLIASSNQGDSQMDVSMTAARIIKAKDDAEVDKQTLASIVRKLLVCGVLLFNFLFN